MKNLFKIIIYLNTFLLFSQNNTEENPIYTTDFSPYFGSILRHKPGISHLITEHPTGFLLSFEKKTSGRKEWERIYNHPTIGFTFYHQNYHNAILGKLYSINAHCAFNLRDYQTKNQFILKIGTGLSYVTNPYDKIENPKNNAFGSHINASILLNLYYQRLQILDNFGLKTGITLLHNSNGGTKSPNSGTNVFAAMLGVNYAFEGKKKENIDDKVNEIPIPEKERVKFNFTFASGKNETDLIGSGKFPFYNFSIYADKRISKKSAFQLGFEYFNSKFLKEYIYYKSLDQNSDEELPDYKRASVIFGHELFISKLSAYVQLGFYIYSPFTYEGNFYENIGMKYYISKNIFGQINLKAHAAKAESFSFGIGCRI
ncbi:acyloxyacyl hydrolase [Aureivirga sp. CE67]|uniref:acyloxyacyl hydrolase n=1 Tax=Aureivirga sp. CE67 TaxID=1788983 RepID=UPI0018C9FAD3|nr:acyloxyacyl hydrolase [Aureivirga sp. CE67]